MPGQLRHQIHGDRLAKYDRGNNGTSCRADTESNQEMKPELNHKKSVNHLYWNVAPTSFAVSKIKQKVAKSQTTTTDWSAIPH